MRRTFYDPAKASITSLNAASVGEITLPLASKVRISPMLLTNTGYTLLFEIRTATGGTALAVTTAKFVLANKAERIVNLDPDTQYYLYWGLVNTTILTNGGAADYLLIDAEV